MDQVRRTSPSRWLELATLPIRFGPDRRAVRRELEGHLEDRAQDLRRIYPELTEKEARERAAADMGDPVEIGRALARIHRPWLGYLWRASQAAAVIAAVCLVRTVGLAALNLWEQAGWEQEDREEWVYAAEIPFVCPEPTQAGLYTLQVEGTLNLSEEGDELGNLALAWTAASPLVWERPTDHLYWQGEDSLGNTYCCHQDIDRAIYVTESWRWVGELTWERDGLGWRGTSQVVNVPREAEWVRLTLDIGTEPIHILLERKEGEA